MVDHTIDYTSSRATAAGCFAVLHESELLFNDRKHGRLEPPTFSEEHFTHITL
jgi:hypothetical protein